MVLKVKKHKTRNQLETTKFTYVDAAVAGGWQRPVDGGAAALVGEQAIAPQIYAAGGARGEKRAAARATRGSKCQKAMRYI